MGIGVLVTCVFVAFTAERGGASATEEVLAAGLLVVFSALTGFAAVALSLEEVVVDDHGVLRHNPIWVDRFLPWDQIDSVSLDTDYNTHPAIRTTDGKTVRLRGAASWWASERSAARRATSAIEARLLNR